MYEVHLRILLAGVPEDIAKAMEAVPARERFTQEFSGYLKLTSDILGEEADIAFFTEEALPENVAPSAVCKLGTISRCILLTDHPADWQQRDLDGLEDIWPATLNADLAVFFFGKLLDRIKTAKDYWLCRNYWQTTINTSPDLIWYKDKIGAHLEINDAFCEVVGKTKNDIRGRGHFYIWGLTEEQYKKGEFVCNETEEAVMKAGHQMVFDEQVLSKHNGMRQLKTYKTPILDEDGVTILGTVGIAMDVTREREYQKRILALARHDALTGLPNRRYFYDYVEEHFDEPKHLLAFDIDNYKTFNDRFGHQVGDEVLVMFSQVMHDIFKNGFCMRFGGDEFLVLYVGRQDHEKIVEAAKAFQLRLRERSQVMQTGVISSSIGIAFDDTGVLSVDSLMKRADEALYEVKTRGKGTCYVWEQTKK